MHIDAHGTICTRHSASEYLCAYGPRTRPCSLPPFVFRDSFNSQYRVRDISRQGATDDQKEGVGEGAGGGREALMSYKGFCAWLNAIPLRSKAQLFSMPAPCLVAKCPASYRALAARTAAQEQQRRDTEDNASAQRDTARIHKILRARPGLEVS